MKKSTVTAIAVISALTVAVFFVGKRLARDRYDNPDRRAWKDNAIAEIKADHKLGTETPFLEGDWLSENRIIFEDGSSILYRQKCHKENRKIHDIFIGHGSDGKWYYSTFHFCIGTIVLRASDQPKSIESFAAEYFLEEFDGVSDKALLPTWPTPNAEQAGGDQPATRGRVDE